jgi:hypothetical protein
VASGGATSKATGFVEVSQLDCLVAVALQCPQLQDMAWTSLNYRHGDDPTVRLEQLGHPDLTAEKSNGHLCRLSMRRLAGSTG